MLEKLVKPVKIVKIDKGAKKWQGIGIILGFGLACGIYCAAKPYLDYLCQMHSTNYKTSTMQKAYFSNPIKK